MVKIQGPKEGKTYSNIYKESGPNLSPWAQKSTLRFMGILGSSLVALVQFSWSLLSNILGGRIASCSTREGNIYTVVSCNYLIKPN